MSGRTSWLRRVEQDAQISVAVARDVVDLDGWIDYDDLARRFQVGPRRIDNTVATLARQGRIHIEPSGQIKHGPAPRTAAYTVMDGAPRELSTIA